MNIREFLYKSGDIFLPKKIRDFLEITIIGCSYKTFYISLWSIVHFLSGILFGFLYIYSNYFDINNYYKNHLIFHTIWEIWQVIIGMSKPWKIVGNSNIVDTILDTILYISGTFIIYNIYL